MNSYLLYYVFGGILACSLLYTWVDMLISRNRVRKQMCDKIKKLCRIREQLVEEWEQFELEKRMKLEIEYVPPNPEEKAIRSRRAALPDLNKLCDNWKRRRFWSAVFLPLHLSWPSKTVNNLQKRLKELDKVETAACQALGEIKKLYDSSIFLTKRKDEEERQAFANKLHKIQLARKREYLNKLMYDVLFHIDYVVRRQQKSSLEIGEYGVDRGLEILNFRKARRSWKRRVEEINELQKEDSQIDEAIAKCQDLFFVFQLEDQDNEDPQEGKNLTYIERAALQIKQTMDVLNGQESLLSELQDRVGVENVLSDELVRAKMLLVEKAAERWSELDPEGLEKYLAEAKKELDTVLTDNQNLQHWAGVIAYSQHKFEWLNRMEKLAKELHGIGLEATKTWKATEKKLQREMPKAWMALDEKRLDGLSEEVEQSINNRQQKLATRVIERVEELELKEGISEEAIQKLMELNQKIMQGPRKSRDAILNLESDYQVKMPGTLRFTSSGVESLGYEEQRQAVREGGSQRRSFMEGIQIARKRYIGND